MNVRSITRYLVVVCSAAVALQLGACAGNIDDDYDGADEPLTSAELAALPEAEQENDDAELAGDDAAATADDGSAFDSDDATDLDDDAVDDDPVAGVQTPTDGLSTQSSPLPLLKYGLHPRASNALRSIGVSASRILQTIGHAAASAGTHAKDGSVNGHPYSAATDISVRGLSATSIRHLLERLGRVGFAAWYRQPGHDGWPSSQIAHIHAVYANCKMKTSLRSQVRSWLVGRNGLVSNTTYRFYRWSTQARDTVRAKFRASAYGTTNGGASCFVGGYYCGGDKISGDHNTLYRCTGSGSPTVIRHCANGCAVRPGQDDACR